eukprot:Skav211235  [mRNA]  locus=scaffold180:154791:155543:- [translate_table: standard]
MSDLRFVITTRLLNTISRWLVFRRFSQARLDVIKPYVSSLLRAASEQLRVWGLQASGWGVWRDDQNHEFRFSMSKVSRDAAMHFIRHGWRKSKIRSWLATKRNDADAARSVGLGEAITNELIDKLRALFKRAEGPHERAIILGSMRTSATVFWGATHPEDSGCPDCLNASCHPTLYHVLWECPAYAHLRRLPPPPCALGQRLGWSPSISRADSQRLISQMAAIREAEVINRMSRERAASSVLAEDTTEDL